MAEDDGPALSGTDGNEPEQGGAPVASNRAQRRAAARAQRRAGLKETNENNKTQAAMAVLMETAGQNRWDAVNRALSELFELDEVAQVYRLKGLVGAIGQVSVEKLQEIANAAINARALLPGPPASENKEDASVETEEEAPQSE